MADNNRLEELFNKWLLRQANPQELQELGSLLKKAGSEQQLSQSSQAIWEKVKTQNLQYPVDWDTIYNAVISSKQARVINFKKRRWYRIAAAAVIIGVLLGGYFFYKSQITNSQSQIVSKKDVDAPKETKAMITLANGDRIYLDSVSNGQLDIGNDLTIQKQGDQIIYQSSVGSLQSTVQYNTLTNPRGSKVIDLTLSDGSHIWLNSGSSITYPVSFAGKERKVSMTGEGFFKVAHNASMPFTLNKGDMSVTVIGTEFNVNAYDDEEDIKVTLLEGSIKVNNGNAANLLRPGQQAQVSNGIKILNNVNVEEVVAWKNGLFDFNNAGLPGIMKQLTRWYDVEVIYKGTAPDKSVTGQISRTVSVSNVLKMIELTGRVKFTIEENKIFVEGK